ncbi:adenosylmethionine decarboxylase [Candidatus Woesearchaeota archaeon]|nr:MAG: adenosylmethionine decarboxylase [Candidatus Woesearchaeota archaeon]
MMGTHLLVNLYGCPKENLERADTVLTYLNQIVQKAELTKIGENAHQFEPFGATAIILLAESHISIHTWPERGEAAVDIFTCADEARNERAFQHLIELFQPERYDKQKVVR